MQCLEWAIAEPDFITKIICNCYQRKAFCVGNCFNEAQRMALELGENGIDAAKSYRYAFITETMIL